ncbi:MAG: family oxidoreductase [Dehalococcoidia bacterium]|nr:family oxidoreductase [Dehalococcoidia bacterium]
MRTLITGIGGFAGGHLAEVLLAQGLDVHGTIRPGDSHPIGPLAKGVTLHQVDLLNERLTGEMMAALSPELVFHLAAQSSVASSWDDPGGTLTNNIMAQLNLLQSLISMKSEARVLVIGSVEEYGAPLPDELPIKESNPLRPANPYALSKVAQDLMGYQYYLSHGIRCVRVRSFNHIGPGQRDTFVTSAFARQVAEAEVGLREPVVRVGNLEARRDFTDVRDVVRGYYLALTAGELGEVYNIGSGKAVSVREILEFFLAQARLQIRVEVDMTRFRPVDVPEVSCDYTKIKERTGWEPSIPLEQSLRDVLEYWRNQVKTST